ncbi:MAG: hypothetical protein ACREO0_13305, partial [Pseudoxanthomonas sp.]
MEIDADGAARQVGPGWETTATPTASVPKQPAAPPRYADSIRAAAEKHGLSPALVDAVARSESGYD